MVQLFRRVFTLLFLATLSLQALSGPLSQKPVENWSAEASLAQRKHQPIMLIFTSEECHYCEQLHQEVILPMKREGVLSSQVHLREFGIERGGKLIDFDGEKIRARLFVSRYHIYATPTVLLLDYQGRPLGEPIVGYNGLEHYRPLLRQAIKSASTYPSLQADSGLVKRR